MKKTKFVRWTWEEDQILRKAVSSQIQMSNPISWIEIARALPGRNNKDCRKRWSKIDTRWRRGGWDPQEDSRLKQSVQEHGLRWSLVAKDVGSRSPDQCAKRWQNAVNPVLHNESWTPEEDDLLQEAVLAIGRNWSTMSERYFPSRSPLSISNRYASIRTSRASDGCSSHRTSRGPDLIPSDCNSDPSPPTAGANITAFDFAGLGNVIGQALTDHLCDHISQPWSVGTDLPTQPSEPYPPMPMQPQTNLYSPQATSTPCSSSSSSMMGSTASMNGVLGCGQYNPFMFLSGWSGFGDTSFMFNGPCEVSGALQIEETGKTMTLSNVDSATMEKILHIVYRPGSPTSIHVGYT